MCQINTCYYCYILTLPTINVDTVVKINNHILNLHTSVEGLHKNEKNQHKGLRIVPETY